MQRRTHARESLGGIFREVSARGEATTAALSRSFGFSTRELTGKIHSLETGKLVIFDQRRKRVSVNPDFGLLAGIDMGASHLHFALTDFRGTLLAESTEKIRPEAGPKKLIAQIRKGVCQLIGDRGARLRGLAIGVPSPVDPRSGLVSFANNLPGWRNVDLRRELKKEFRVPVAVENDANMAAIGEHWRGVARGVKNFIFIALGTGIGSGVFVNGRLYVGRRGAAGELHPMNVEWQRWDEDFGDTGYFESYASGMGIAALGRELMGTASKKMSLAEGRDARFVFDAFRQGNPDARKTLETIFTMLAVGIANSVAVLDPDLIVLGGGITKGAPDFMLATVRKVVRRIQPEMPPILLSALEDKAQTFGAIFSALTAAHEAVMKKLGG